MRIQGFIALVVGSCLFYCTGKKPGVPDKPTFTKDIAPIIFRSCATCHHSDGIAPFPLTNYQEVRRKAKTIAKVTANRTMPPWPADPNYSHFIGENRLSDKEIATIQRWVEQKMPEGDASFLPELKLPEYNSAIGKPDMVLELDTVLLEGDMRDRFFLVKIPGILPHDTFLRAIEFIAGSPDLVHHFNGHLLLYDAGKKSNLMEGFRKVEISNGKYEADFKKLDLLHDDGSFPFRVHSAVNYLPGVFGTAYPDGIGTIRLSKNFAVVGNDMHYGPAAKRTIDKSYIHLFFTDKPPTRQVAEIMLGTNGVSKIEPPLSIAPNTVSKHVTRFLVNQDISVLTVNPHLHLLGKSFLAYALKPNGDTIKLVRIPAWDFRWQYFYTFQYMQHIPKGSTIVAEAVFDNTKKNPNNPNSPPKRVGERLEFGGASMRATDEMFQFIVTYTAYQVGDEKKSLLSGK